MKPPGGWVKPSLTALMLSAATALMILTACRQPPEYKLSYACLNRDLAPCVAAQEFASQVSDRTNGRMRIKVTSMGAGELRGGKILLLMKEGTIAMAELYRAHFPLDGDAAILDISDFWVCTTITRSRPG